MLWVAVSFESSVSSPGIGGAVGEVELMEAPRRLVPVSGGGEVRRPGSEYGTNRLVLVGEDGGARLAVPVESLLDAVELPVQARELVDVLAVPIVLLPELGDLLVEAGEFLLPSPDLAGGSPQRGLGIGDGGGVPGRRRGLS